MGPGFVWGGKDEFACLYLKSNVFVKQILKVLADYCLNLVLYDRALTINNIPRHVALLDFCLSF